MIHSIALVTNSHPLHLRSCCAQNTRSTPTTAHTPRECRCSRTSARRKKNKSPKRRPPPQKAKKGAKREAKRPQQKGRLLKLGRNKHVANEGVMFLGKGG